jgi:D-amino peptidase
MRVLIWNDMEGPSGIDNRKMLEDQELYLTARKYATDDVNAAIRGVRKAQPKAVIDIFDGHGMGDNLLVDELEPDCNYLGGGWMTTFYEMVTSGELPKYSAVLLLGQHAGEGTKDGFLSHTNTGMTQLSVNGQFAGEAPQIAWLFGHFGVPTPLVVGDDAVCREVDVLLPGIKSVAVKKSKDQSTAKSLPLAEAHTLIEQTSFEVISQLADFSPYVVDLPAIIEVSYLLEEMAVIHAKFPKTIKASNNSVKYTADDYLEAWLAYNIARVVIDYYFRDNFLKLLIQLDLDFVKEKLQEYQTEIRKKIENYYPFPAVKY